MSDEYKKTHGEIPWSMVSELRHRLVHDYDGTNWNIIVEVVFEELPILIEEENATYPNINASSTGL